MPTLINKIQDRQNIAKWKKEYSLISNAFQNAIGNGYTVCGNLPSATCPGSAGGPMADEFREKILEQLKVVDYCTGSGAKACDYYNGDAHKNAKYKWSGVAGTYSRYKALGNTSAPNNSGSPYGISAYNFGGPVYLLKDGSAVYFGGTHGGPWVVVDVNNFTHGPNEFGRDVFVMKIYTDINKNQHWIKPMGADGTYNKTVNGDTCECSKDKGAKTGSYIADMGGQGEVISGACCSAYYLYAK